jgi:hypothetical protein
LSGAPRCFASLTGTPSAYGKIRNPCG